MRRRDVIGLLSAGLVWPIAARAAPEPLRQIGVLLVGGENPDSAARIAGLKDGLQALGWTEGSTIHIEFRYGRSDPERIRRGTEELIALKPDVILAQGVVGAAALKRATKSIPVVFVQVQDPVGGGFVKSIARPDENLTGFTNFEYTISGKWLQLLKDAFPNVTRALVLINPDNLARWNGYKAVIDSVAPSVGVHPVHAGVHDAGEIEQAIAALAAEPNGGLLVLPDATTSVHSNLIIELAARHRLPAVYPYRYYAQAGGILAYSSNVAEEYRRAASYIDRLLRGAKVSDLPIQASERFETVLNQKTATALGFSIPSAFLARVDEIIE